MKKYMVCIGLLLAVLCGGAAWAVHVQADQEEAVTFDGQKYYLQYSMGSSQEWLNEYLPKGADFKSYKYMFTARAYDGVSATPQQIGSAIIANLQKTRPGATYSFFPGNGTDAGLHFMMFQGNILEFNLFRITMQNGHPLALQFVYREYVNKQNADEVAKLMSATLNKKLSAWSKEIMSMPVPSINRTVKQ